MEIRDRDTGLEAQPQWAWASCSGLIRQADSQLERHDLSLGLGFRSKSMACESRVVHL